MTKSHTKAVLRNIVGDLPYIAGEASKHPEFRAITLATHADAAAAYLAAIRFAAIYIDQYYLDETAVEKPRLTLVVGKKNPGDASTPPGQ